MATPPAGLLDFEMLCFCLEDGNASEKKTNKQD